MQRSPDDFHQLTGPQRAAVFLLALGDRHAGNLFERMDEDEIRDLSQTMATLGTINAAIVERLFLELVDQLSSAGSLIGSFDSTERLLTKFLDRDRVTHIMDEIRGPAGRTMWDKLGNVSEGVLATFLKNEYPQTVSVVLSKIKPDHAARVLALLPENFAMEVIMRMLRMEPVQKEILDHVERTLRTEFMTNLARTSRRDSHEVMAEIFNNFDRTTENRFMTALEERNRDAAERIKELMFTFEDLVRINGNGIQQLLRRVEKEKLALALKGASEKVKQLVFENMSERAAKMLREDMEALGPVRLREVDEAQAVIINTTKALAEAGEITLVSPGDSDQLVY
jgi:flagellar motor switch protein FliG